MRYLVTLLDPTKKKEFEEILRSGGINADHLDENTSIILGFYINPVSVESIEEIDKERYVLELDSSIASEIMECDLNFIIGFEPLNSVGADEIDLEKKYLLLKKLSSEELRSFREIIGVRIVSEEQRELTRANKAFNDYLEIGDENALKEATEAIDEYKKLESKEHLC